MDEAQEEGAKGERSKKIAFIVISAIIMGTIGIVIFYGARKTTTVKPPQPPPPYTLTPSNVTSAAGVTQSFTADYPISGGWQNLTDASFYLAGGGHDQWVHYYPAKNSFFLEGVKGGCKPGQAAKISSKFLTLNCDASSVSGPGDKPKVTFSITPRPSFSGEKYVLVVVTYDSNKASAGALAGNWTVK